MTRTPGQGLLELPVTGAGARLLLLTEQQPPELLAEGLDVVGDVVGGLGRGPESAPPSIAVPGSWYVRASSARGSCNGTS